MRILFVEDQAAFARIVTRQFLAGHQITLATSLFEARLALETGDFDVVLLDTDLPDGKGDELARELVARPVRPKILAVSSHDAGNDAITHAGADARCSKARFGEIGEVLLKFGVPNA